MKVQATFIGVPVQIIISPAKQMRVNPDSFAAEGIPPFPHETAALHGALCGILREQGAAGLQALWRVSDRLLDQNLGVLERFVPVLDEKDLRDPSVAARVTPAVFSYHGIQYQSLAPEVLDQPALDWLQRHLWILSGLYGCVRPFDAVEPYRLEMGAKLAVGDAGNLYAFWGDRLAGAVARGAAETVVNLASVEYAQAVLPHLPASVTVVTCLFGETMRSGKPVQRATASKIARGSMVRWLAENELDDPRALADFSVGYRFAPELSQREGSRQVIVFMREP